MNASHRSDLFRSRGLGAALRRTLAVGSFGLALIAATGAQGTAGEVLHHAKFSAPSGGTFGGALKSLADLDGDGIDELAVGARDTGAGTGAVWIQFLNGDGSVRTAVQLPTPADVTPGEEYGISIASLGDLDGAGPSVHAIAVGCVGDEGPIGPTDTGAVYVCFLDSQGNELVGNRKKIANGTAGLGSPLSAGDRFGHGLESLGDLDGDGFTELAVGTILDDEHASGSGAIWILHLDAAGSVVSADKRLPPAAVQAGAQFGSGIADLGDLGGTGGTTLAVGARQDVLGVNNGAVWILFLDSSCQILASVKLNGLAGFPAQVDAGDTFGNSVAGLGDVDGSGRYALAVGAPFDDPQSFAGSVFVVFLEFAGTTVSIDDYVYITEGSGGFSGNLDAGDLFGESVAAIGDLDGDGRKDLAVGAGFDDDSATNRGAVWVLFLNDGTIDLSNVTRWEGDSGGNPTDWTRIQNWSGSVPNSTTTVVIPDVANAPVITGTAACRHLIIEPGASLTVGGTGSLAIHQGATLLGPISGAGSVTFAGAGTLSGSASVTAGAGLTFNADIAMQGGPLLVGSGTTLTVNQDLTIEAGGELECDGPVVLQSGANGTLTGPGTLDCDGDLTLDLVSTAPPRIEVAGNLSVNSAVGRFRPASGTVRFDGAIPQTVTQLGGVPIRLHDLEVADSADVLFQQDLIVAGHTLWEGSGDSTGSFFFEDDVTGALAFSSGGGSRRTFPTIQGGDIHTLGDLLFAGILDNRGTLEVDTSRGVTVYVPNGVAADVEVIGNGVAVFTGGDFTATGAFDILGGTVVTDGDLDLTVLSLSIAGPGALDVQGNRIDVLGNPPISVLGELRVAAGGELGLSACTVDVGNGGLLELAGASGIPAEVEAADASPGGYTIQVQAGGTLAAGEFLIRDSGAGAIPGLEVDLGAFLGPDPLDLRNGTFDQIASASSGFLDIERTTAVELVGLRFDGGLPGSFNVSVPSTSATVRLVDWSGSFGGTAFEPSIDDFAEWGTELLSLSVQETATANVVRWDTVRQGEAFEYVITRAPIAFPGSGEITIPTTGPSVVLQTYTHTDPLPAVVHRYQLFERFSGGALRFLGSVQAIPPRQPPSFPPTLLPLPTPVGLGQGTGGPVAGPAGNFPSIEEALSASHDDASVLALRLARGLHPAFEVRGRSVVLEASLRSEAWIDVSAGPVRIVGLAPDQSVELVGLRFVGARSGSPALVIEDCLGLVQLTDIDAGELHVQASRGVLVRESRLERLRLAPGSRAFVLDGNVAALSLAAGARLESFGLAGQPPVDGPGTWMAASQAEATLALLDERRADLELELRAAAGSCAWLLAAPHPGLGPVARGLPLLLEHSALVRSPVRHVGSSGMLTLELARTAPGAPLYLQALVLDPRSGRVALTDLVRVGAH